MKMVSEYVARVAAMRNWREWIDMPVDPTIIEILKESHPRQLAKHGYFPNPSVSTAYTSSAGENKAVGRKRKVRNPRTSL